METEQLKWRWQELEKRIPVDKKIIGIEIGVWTGKTSLYLLERKPLLMQYMVDPYTDPKNIESFFNSGAKMAKYSQDVYEKVYQDLSMAIHKFGDRATLIRKTSIEASDLFFDKYFDYIFIDGDHSHEGVSQDIDIWLPKLKNGGTLAGHDYKNSGKGFRGVKQAVDERFSNIELGADTTWFYKKLER